MGQCMTIQLEGEEHRPSAPGTSRPRHKRRKKGSAARNTRPKAKSNSRPEPHASRDQGSTPGPQARQSSGVSLKECGSNASPSIPAPTRGAGCSCKAFSKPTANEHEIKPTVQHFAHHSDPEAGLKMFKEHVSFHKIVASKDAFAQDPEELSSLMQKVRRM